MNCPRCGRELTEVAGVASCAPCNITVGVHKAVQPDPVKEEVIEEPAEVNPEDVEESAEAEGFPQEDNQESEEEAKE